jgi:hypothetical protein
VTETKRKLLRENAVIKSQGAEVVLVPGRAVSRTYLWLGNAHGEFVGTVEWSQLKRLARIVLEMEGAKP